MSHLITPTDAPYRLSSHALDRINERNLAPEHLLAAIETHRAFSQQNGMLVFRDPRSRVAVVVDPGAGRIVTAFRLQRKQIKRSYSR